MTVVLGEMDGALAKRLLWLEEVAYQRTNRLMRIRPASDSHQIPGVALGQPHTRWTTATRPELSRALG